MADLVATRAGPGGERREQAAASRPGNGRGSGPVVAVLVVCDGIAWLPAALAALMGQQRAPDRIVVVDVGSVDGSGLLCMRTLGAARLLRLVRMTRGTSFATAVARGLAAAGGPPAGGFVWLLHDDAAPRPDALENLLLYA
ncbi:MAG: glycosyltransferase, partial [Frankia sp.]